MTLSVRCPRSGLRRIAALAAGLLFCAAAKLQGQTVESRAPVEHFELGGRVHVQYNTSSVDEDVASEFKLRRARIWVAARINDWIDGAADIDFSGASASATLVFIRFAVDPSLHISVGQLKRAFDVFELTSSADILVVERDGAIRGVDGCAGVGGLCSYSRFTEQLDLSSLDVGVMLEGSVAGGRLSYLTTLTNGPGRNQVDENSAKSWSGRLAWHAGHTVTLAANAAFHDHPGADGSAAYAPAGGLDVEVGDFKQGLHIQAGLLTGDNWRNEVADGGTSTFLTTQAIVTYQFPLQGGKIQSVEPLARVSWGDPDRDASGDGGILLTPGVVLHLDGRNKLAANLDAWRPQGGSTAWSLKMQAYVYF